MSFVLCIALPFRDDTLKKLQTMELSHVERDLSEIVLIHPAQHNRL